MGGTVTVQAGGTIGAGNSPGHLTINGDLNLSGTLVAELGGPAEGTQYRLDPGLGDRLPRRGGRREPGRRLCPADGQRLRHCDGGGGSCRRASAR